MSERQVAVNAYMNGIITEDELDARMAQLDADHPCTCGAKDDEDGICTCE